MRLIPLIQRRLFRLGSWEERRANRSSVRHSTLRTLHQLLSPPLHPLFELLLTSPSPRNRTWLRRRSRARMRAPPLHLRSRKSRSSSCQPNGARALRHSHRLHRLLPLPLLLLLRLLFPRNSCDRLLHPPQLPLLQ